MGGKNGENNKKTDWLIICIYIYILYRCRYTGRLVVKLTTFGPLGFQRSKITKPNQIAMNKGQFGQYTSCTFDNSPSVWDWPRPHAGWRRRWFTSLNFTPHVHDWFAIDLQLLLTNTPGDFKETVNIRRKVRVLLRLPNYSWCLWLHKV